MDLQYLFLIFRARFAWIALCGIIFAALALGAGLLLHRRSATATLLLSSPIVEFDASRRSGPPAGPESSAVEVLSSPRVVQRVIATLKLTPDHPQALSWGSMGETETSGGDWMVARVLKDVRFTTAADSSIVTVTGYSRDPEFAKALANAFAQAYQQVSREVQADHARARAEQLEQGLPRIEEELRSARASITAFHKAHPGFNPDERNAASSGTVAALSTQLAQVQAELTSRTAARATDDLPDPALQGLQLEARRARARWQEVSAKYGMNHPAYAEAAAEIERAEGALQAATNSTSRANSRKAGSLRAAIELQQKEAVGRAALHEEYSAFQRSLAAAETSANTMRTALRQARLERDAALGTAAVFSPATLQPAGPTDPWRRALPLGAALGFLLGSILALLAEEWSPRVRRSRSTIAALGTRLLARVPAATARHRTPSALLADRTDGGGLEPSLDVPADAHTQREQALGRIVAPEQVVGPASPQRLPEALHARVPPIAGDRQLDRGPDDGPRPSPSFVVDLNPTHPVAEAVRELRTNVLLDWRQSGERRPICLQSLQHGDGRTFVACNLAIAFAQASLRTVLVDLDLRTPGLHKLFGLHAGGGVAGLLAGQQVTPRTVDSRGFLDVLSAGPRVPNPQELVSGTGLIDLLHDLNQRYQAVVIDGPAWSCAADAQLLASAGTDVVLVARSDHTPLRQLQEMRDRLGQLQVRVLGVVTNEH